MNNCVGIPKSLSKLFIAKFILSILFLLTYSMCIVLKISIVVKIKIFHCISIEGDYVYRISDQQAGTELNFECNAHVPC